MCIFRTAWFHLQIDYIAKIMSHDRITGGYWENVSKNRTTLVLTYWLLTWIEAIGAFVGEFALEGSDHVRCPICSAGNTNNPFWYCSYRSGGSFQNGRGDAIHGHDSISSQACNHRCSRSRGCHRQNHSTQHRGRDESNVDSYFVRTDFHTPNIACVVQNRQIRPHGNGSISAFRNAKKKKQQTLYQICSEIQVHEDSQTTPQHPDVYVEKRKERETREMEEWRQRTLNDTRSERRRMVL